jgi:DNA-binding NarL/FixJ family response regulator
MVRVLLAVMHPLLRAALVEYLGAGDLLCDEAASPAELWDRLQLGIWDVLILDLHLPQQNKLQTLQVVHQHYPTLPILTMSFADDIPVHRWRDAGASAFVSKTKLGEKLLEAVRVLSQGGTYFATGDVTEKIP